MTRTLVLVLVAALFLGSNALAATASPATPTQVFVTVDGIAGESTTKGHEGQIEAFNFSETWRQTATTGGGTGGGAGKATLGPVVFDKVQGVGSVRLLKALLAGRIIAKVILDFGQGTDGKGPTTYRITLLNVIVVGLNQASTADGTLVDEVQLTFDSATWEVFDPSDSTGFDSTTGKVNLTAPTGNRSAR
jgi:type VI secretion system secreted protein Hcp